MVEYGVRLKDTQHILIEDLEALNVKSSAIKLFDGCGLEGMPVENLMDKWGGCSRVGLPWLMDFNELLWILIRHYKKSRYDEHNRLHTKPGYGVKYRDEYLYDDKDRVIYYSNGITAEFMQYAYGNKSTLTIPHASVGRPLNTYTYKSVSELLMPLTVPNVVVEESTPNIPVPATAKDGSSTTTTYTDEDGVKVVRIENTDGSGSTYALDENSPEGTDIMDCLVRRVVLSKDDVSGNDIYITEDYVEEGIIRGVFNKYGMQLTQIVIDNDGEETVNYVLTHGVSIDAYTLYVDGDVIVTLKLT